MYLQVFMHADLCLWCWTLLWPRNLPGKAYSQACLSTHPCSVRSILHVFNQQIQLTFLRDIYLPEEVFLVVAFFSIPDSSFRPVILYWSRFQNSESFWNPLSPTNWSYVCFFPCSTCIPRRWFQLVALLIFLCVSHKEVQFYTYSSVIQKLFLLFYCTVRHYIFYFQFHPPTLLPAVTASDTQHNKLRLQIRISIFR